LDITDCKDERVNADGDEEPKTKRRGKYYPASPLFRRQRNWIRWRRNHMPMMRMSHDEQRVNGVRILLERLPIRKSATRQVSGNLRYRERNCRHRPIVQVT
jgi:hypothetical protein